MNNNCLQSYVRCGRVFDIYLPKELDQSEPPIIIAEVNVNIRYVQDACVLVKFSEFINFTLLGLNPKLEIVYRLVRKNEYTNDEQILESWDFQFETPNIKEGANIDTKQPTVLSYCDCLDCCVGERFSYKLEIIKIVTNSVKSYSLSNKSISATVIKEGFCIKENKLPYIKQGTVFNPVLPLNLSEEDDAIELSKVNIYTKCNESIGVLIDFSGFVTSILREDDFNRLTFRLIKVCDDCTSEILREWPFKRAFVNDTNIKEPIVYDYCETIKNEYDLKYTYIFQLVEAELSKNSFYDITNKSMTAQIYLGKDDYFC